MIGGGCGAIAAAFELSRPEHLGRFQITVYQEGWRLGGKGASGRGPSGRVEEHGLHVWLGFYENAFAMMRQCHEELARNGTMDFGAFEDAFLPEPDIGLFAPFEHGGWQQWRGRFPPRPGRPGDPITTREVTSLAGYLRAAASLLATLLLDVDVARHGGAPPVTPPGPPATAAADTDRIVAAVRKLLARGVFAGSVVLVEALSLLAHAIGRVPAGFDTLLLRLAESITRGLRQWLEDHLVADDEQRHVWEVMDLVVAAMVGCLRDRLLTDPRGLDAINDEDCRGWLRRHGASERALASPFVQGLYDLALAYEDGDPERPGIAAGQGMRGALRMFFGYRGALFWRMRAGMGDVVFAPLYTLLRQRGVRFEFFHRLTNIGLAPGGELAPGERTHVASLDFDLQAEIADGGAYRPLVEVAGRPCWPSQPDYAQLCDGKRIAAEARDFESHWDRTRVGTRRLEVGNDFDFVVLGVGIGAVPHVASELLARDARWRRMVAEVKTVATQAFQIWLDTDLDTLGWRGPPYIASAFVKPFDTWCDMAHVVPEEAWTTPPATAVYFCGVLRDPPAPAADDDTGYPARRRHEVLANAEEFLGETVRPLWPGAYAADGEFRWDLLATDDPGAAATGPARFASQYWRANVNPSDRYVLSLPGSLQHRISPLDMTYDNLTLAGDWTDCGLNTGCTEAAVIAGRLAAHALAGLPALEDITGYDHP